MLIAARTPYDTMMNAPLTSEFPKTGEICASVSTQTLITAAVARTFAPNHRHIATMNPMYGPNAVSAYP